MKLRILFLLSLLLGSCLNAQVTYVDATSGAGGNTTLADGSVFTPPLNVTTGSDNNWEQRTTFGSGGNIYEAGGEAAENAPELKTTISGLTPGASYRIYVYFWDSDDASAGWYIRSGFASNPGANSLYSTLDGSVPASSLTHSTAPTVFTEGNRTLYAASLGNIVADGNGRIAVFLDDLPVTNNVSQRTWFDGVGYQLGNNDPDALPITVDPALAMTGSWGTDWNTNGNLENWTPTNATASVAGGVLSGTATTTDSSIRLNNFAGGPNLDLGFNDFLEIKIQVPASYTGAIQVFYGTTMTTGYSAARVLTIPADRIPKDGAFHTYRIQLGLEVYWRGTLRDLRIDAVDGAGTSGMSFAVDYIRIGDDPAAVAYTARITTECPAAGGATPSGALIGPNEAVMSMESKHFRFLWNASAASNSAWVSSMPNGASGALRNAEECWQVLVKKLGYREPCFATGTTSGTRYKVNITTWHAGYWAGLDGNYARLNITPDGLRENPPTGVLPHEFTHVIQFHNSSNYVPGAWWEGHANYGRERYLQHFGALYPANQRSGIDPTYLRCAHQILGHGRDYYLSWPMFMYLDENPDNLSDLGEGTMVKLWQQAQINEYPLMTLERLTPSSTLKDIVGNFARRQATYNYQSKADIQAALATFGAPLDNAATSRWQFTDLVQRPDDATWWRVPYEMAPMQGAYAIHELVPSGSGGGRVVSVNFRGLADSGRGADWRASFIVIADDGTERYSSLWGNGSNSVTLAANENKICLSVAGAPATFHVGAPNASFEGDFNNNTYPYRSAPSKARFPYEIQVTGASPKQRDNGSTSGLTQHSNGGGWRSVSVPASVYIGPNARVTGGTVSGNARIEDYARVTGGAVTGDAVISGHAWVRGGSVSGFAKVRDWALIESGTVTGSARVLEHANIKGATVQDTATAKGTAASNSGTISGNGMIDGDFGDFFYGRNVANAIAFGHQPYEGVPDSWLIPLPAGLYARYNFDNAHDSRVLDQYGVTDGFTVGAPTWVSADAKRSGFLSFDGTTQHVNLDRSVADLRDFTFTAWVKPLGGASNQAVLWLGASNTKRLSFTPDDGSGNAKFSIVNGGAEQTLSAPALPIGIWTHVGITLNGSTGALYLNGNAVASGSITIRADQILAANTASTPQQNYLARSQGSSMARFRGTLDDVAFYSAALSAGDMAAWQAPTSVETAGTLYVDLRATDASAGAATWLNNGTIGNFTRVGSPAVTTINGVPAVSFNGSNQAYTSLNNTVADLEGSSGRSIEVWAYNPALADEETTVSWAFRGGSPDGSNMAFNFGSHGTWGAVTHWGGGYDTNWGSSNPSANAWHHLVYTYDNGTTVKIYLDGVLANTRTMNGVLATWAAKPINIGRQRDNSGGSSFSKYFSGYLNTVRVHGATLSAAQVANNHALGPAGGSANSAPTLSVVADQTVPFGIASIQIPLSVDDSDTVLSSVTLSGSATDSSLLPPENIAFIGTGASRIATITPVSGMTGSTTVTFTVGDGASTSSRTFNLALLTPHETWLQSHYGSDWSNPAVSGDMVDLDGDGTGNLLERAFGGNPNVAEQDLLPRTDPSAPLLSIIYRKAVAATDLQYEVVKSGDMEPASWQPATGTSSTVETLNEGAVEVIRFTADIAGSPKVFLRVKVTKTP